MADTIARVLPVQSLIEEKDRAKFNAQRSTFWRFLDHVAEATDDPALRAMQRFGEWLKTNPTAPETVTKEVEAKELATTHLCTFAWLPDENIGQPILTRDAVRKWWREFFVADRLSKQSSGRIGHCQVTEQAASIPKTNEIRVNGLYRIGCRPDVNLVVGKLDCADSYNLTGAQRSMVSADALDAVTRTLNTLIANELPNGDKSCLIVGRNVFLFWVRGKSNVDLMLFDRPTNEEIVRLIESVRDGRRGYGIDPNQFFCLSIAGNSKKNATRLVVCDYLEMPVLKVQENLAKWFSDLAIVDPFANETTSAFPLWILANCTIRTGDDLPPDLASLLMSAALKGTAVPLHVLATCLRRMRVESGTEQFRPARLALLKLILNRLLSKGERPMTAELDSERTTDPAYVCGRMFACLAYIQAFERNPKKHGFGQEAAMLSGYYGAASSAPRSVFGTLLRQTQHRLNKLGGEYGSFVTNRSKELEEFSQHLGSALIWQADFPSILSLAGQGRFALGFYHQRAAYRTASADRRIAEAAGTEN